MVWTQVASATQAAVIGTEHTLTTTVANGTFVLTVDTRAMQNGDVLELRAYYINLSGGVEGLVFPPASYVHVQTDTEKQWHPIQSDVSVRFTLKQVAGTGRSYPWKVELI